MLIYIHERHDMLWNGVSSLSVCKWSVCPDFVVRIQTELIQLSKFKVIFFFFSVASKGYRQDIDKTISFRVLQLDTFHHYEEWKVSIFFFSRLEKVKGQMQQERGMRCSVDWAMCRSSVRLKLADGTACISWYSIYLRDISFQHLRKCG
jgi:hypothetical protein